MTRSGFYPSIRFTRTNFIFHPKGLAMKIKNLAIGCTLAASSILAVPTAQAADWECGGNLVCIFDHANYGGFLGSRGSGIGLMNVSRNANDKTSSWINNTWSNAAWYHDANGQGKCHTMTQQSRNNYVGFWNNDRLSSWRTNRGC